jgi:multimeric flavodoxin WrbA
MKVVGIVGSPRIDGTTDALVRKVLDGCEYAGAGTEVFHLGGLDIHGCRGCMSCNETGDCVQDDDMGLLYDRIREADAIVLGTPIYFWYMTGQMKSFTDRLFAFVKPGSEHRLGDGRKTVVVVTQGADSDVFGSQIEAMKTAWSYAGLDTVDTIKGMGYAGPEDIASDGELMARAFEAGRKLAGEA